MFLDTTWEAARMAPARVSGTLLLLPESLAVKDVGMTLRRAILFVACLAMCPGVRADELIADDPTLFVGDAAIAAGQPPVATAPIAAAPAAATPIAAAPAAAAPLAKDADDAHQLRFSFSGAPWREVLNWLAEESNLALHVSDLPAGSFTYSDPDAFTTDQAIARINLFLIPQGYALVRRGKLLSALGLGDPRSLQQLDALATLAPVDDLEKFSEHEVIKCMIPLGGVQADAALAELRPLMLMSAPVVLPKSNQLVVTETAGKLRSVVAVVRAMDEPQAEAVVKRFDLQHVDLETVTMVAASHLGLASGESAGADISMSTDLSGKTLFVTGSQEKVARLETLLQVLDVPSQAAGSLSQMKLRSHAVSGDNLQAVYDVLQTILAGKSLRLSMQSSTNSIVALADESVHQEIETTIAELQAPAIDFAVIQLNKADPYFVVTLIGEMFETPGTSRASDSRSRSRSSESDSAPAIAPPRIDADPANRRLFVRGTSEQIAQIQQMVDSLEGGTTGGTEVRLLPLRGQQRQQVLEAAERYWRGDNRVLILPSAEGTHADAIERAIHPEHPQNQPEDRAVTAPAVPHPLSEDTARVSGDSEATADRGAAPSEGPVMTAALSELVSLPSEYVSHPRESAGQTASARVAKAGRSASPPIRGQLIPQGIMLQSEDLAALDQFQEHLMEIASSTSQTPSPPVVYYLKYVSAEDAVKMLADLLDGGSSLTQAPSSSLVNAGIIGRPGSGYFGSFTMKRDGLTTVTAGTATIVSDARLNRLIVQGTTEDVSVIDGYLKIIDKGSSITSIETFGRSHVIELLHTKAADVAEVVKQAYAGRIAKETQPGGQGNPQPAPPSGQRASSDSDAARGDAQRDAIDKPTRGRQPEMTVAVHEASNSLVITAPDALFAEVEALVQSVDTRSEQVVEVITASAGVDIEMIMQALNGDAQGTQRSSSNQRSASSQRSTSSQRSSSDSRRSSSR